QTPACHPGIAGGLPRGNYIAQGDDEYQETSRHHELRDRDTQKAKQLPPAEEKKDGHRTGGQD
ncbi:MAG TPA: hypothetical protein PLA82_07275, partial [Deltaproteobacteria bacterium]|nr:hypothetical protein [Deltaproteobacteria bacterium]